MLRQFADKDRMTKNSVQSCRLLPWVGSFPPYDKQVTLFFLILGLEFGWLV